MELEELNQLFPVQLINPYHYPIRVLTWMDEDTGESTFAVIKQFGRLNTEINRLTYEHLRRDPKVQVVVEPQET
jgi:hypothetical protein